MLSFFCDLRSVVAEKAQARMDGALTVVDKLSLMRCGMSRACALGLAGCFPFVILRSVDSEEARVRMDDASPVFDTLSWMRCSMSRACALE